MPITTYTIIAEYADNGEVFAETFEASSPEEAGASAQASVRAALDGSTELILLAAIPGSHQVHALS